MFDRRVWEVVRGCERDSLSYALLCFATFSLDAVCAVLLALVTTSVLEGAPSWPAVAALPLALLLRAPLSYARSARRVSAQAAAALEANGRLCEKYARLCWASEADDYGPDFLWCAGEGARRLGELFGEVLPRMIGALALALPVTVATLFVCWQVSVTFFVTAVAVLASLVTGATAERNRVMNERIEDMHAVSASAADYFAIVMRESETLRDYHVESDFVELAAARGTKAEHVRLQRAERGLMLITFTLAVGTCGAVVVGHICSQLSRAGELSPLFALALALVCAYATARIAMLAISIPHMAEAEVAQGCMVELLALREPAEHGSAVAEPGDHLALSHVSYSHDGEDEALFDISLDVPAVGLTAVVGPAGSGKTTLAQVLSGHVTDYEGTVFLGGKQFRDFPRTARLRYVTHVDGASGLVAASVRENLQMADLSATEAEMWSVLETVGLDSEIRRRGGLDYDLSAADVELSQSERLRLVFARALLHNSPVLVIDALMDDVNPVDGERAMMALRAIARYKAVVYLTRHPSQARFAKLEYVLSGGRIIASGTHEALLASCEEYRLAFEEQDRALSLTAMPSDQTVVLAQGGDAHAAN